MDSDLFSQKQIKFASFTSRVAASFFDATIILIVLIPITALFKPLIYGNKLPQIFWQNLLQDMKSSDLTVTSANVFSDPRVYEFFIIQGGLKNILIDNLIQFAIFTLIVIISWFYCQTTIGKMLLSLRIVDSSSLLPPSRKQLILRFIGYIISSLPLFLGFIWMIFDKRKQTWHDKLAGTIVIKK